MGCNSFIYKVIDTGFGKKIIKASKFFSNKMYVTISDLYENKKCHLVESSHRRLNNGESNET